MKFRNPPPGTRAPCPAHYWLPLNCAYCAWNNWKADRVRVAREAMKP